MSGLQTLITQDIAAHRRLSIGYNLSFIDRFWSIAAEKQPGNNILIWRRRISNALFKASAPAAAIPCDRVKVTSS
jgi:hypothetical protein